MTEDAALHHIGLIYYVIKRNKGRIGSYKIDRDEAFSAGLVGLAIAINDYNEETCSVEFYKFAYQKIWNSIFTNRRRHDIRCGLLRIKQAFFQKTGRHIRDDQLVKLLGEEKMLSKLLQDHLREMISFSSYAHNDEDREAIFTDKNIPLPEDELNNKFVAETIQAVINDRTILTDEERKIVKLYYSINLPRCVSMKEIGLLFGCSNEAIRLRINNILERLSANRQLKVLATDNLQLA